MLLTVLLLLAGFALILKGGDYFVGASVAIAQFARVPRIIIGSTIVSIATTSPEFFVSTTASLTGRSQIAFGNAIGSVIADIALILGLICIVRPIPVIRDLFHLPSRALLVCALLVSALAVRLTLSRGSGFILLAVAFVFLLLNYLDSKRRALHSGQVQIEPRFNDPRMRTPGRAILFFLLGLGMVVGSSRILVDSAVKIARAIGVPDIFIGLTLVALGTSLPELVTAITCVRRQVTDLSLGNLLGASVLCCTWVTGASAAIAPLSISKITFMYNMPAMLLLVTAVIALARAGDRLGRFDGAVLLILYATYVVGLLLFHVA